jgi:gamma-glutamyltranspeptidase/glutathione hydrolase
VNRSLEVCASNAGLREAVERAALEEQSALSAALGVYLWDCALRPGVLLSSVSVLLVGFGARRAIDGRVRQPGRGSPRPRGFVPSAPIPRQARVAIPTSIPALFVASSYGAASAPAAAFRAASAVAKRQGANARAELLARAAAQGGTAFHGSAAARELLRVAGKAEGGLVSSEDFLPHTDIDHPVSVPIEFPWASENSASGSTNEVVIAIDRRGGAAVVCYDVAQEGIAICDGELVVPLAAVPVLRGVTRVRPGTPLPHRVGGRIELDPEDASVRAVTSGPLSLDAPVRR